MREVAKRVGISNPYFIFQIERGLRASSDAVVESIAPSARYLSQ
jgi:hypothetical protein